MEYRLKIKALGVFPSVEIDEGKFFSLCQSRRALSNALLGEEAYDLLVSNHEEFERELASLAVGRMMRSEYSYEAFFAIKAVLARRLANLVTAGRIYVDQAPRYHAQTMGLRSELRLARTSMNREYDRSFAYRFMETYRNHVQHYSSTVDSISLGGARDKATQQLAYVVEPYAEKAKLGLNRKFKKDVLDEMPDKVDLRRMARGYLAALSVVHAELRNRSKPVIDEAKTVIETAIAEYERELGKKPAGLFAIQEENGKELACFPLLTDWHRAFELLIERNHGYKDLERHYVTTQFRA
ncbi:hypothetical protein N799_05075 [Lysobacter arseniciresistens ZS79]|uniref:Uncharacterized protein n=1 Tax=Lysobacter arseniciresistens ZS79 TaxID=913325 RepID=A0A0A0F052_9GAMM|nr:hypothetical protein [Lysobacter arseniciresistens]KGM56164.1 hypothetical protein N799_05075 [Lysobacter arseniciresistens ZS79]